LTSESRPVDPAASARGSRDTPADTALDASAEPLRILASSVALTRGVASRALAGAGATPGLARGRVPEGRGAPRLLLLTSTLGAGHARATQSIELAIRERDRRAEMQTLDFWALMDREVAFGVRETYMRLVSEHPALYDYVYHLDQAAWRDILIGSRVPPQAVADVMALMPRAGERRVGAPAGSSIYPFDRLAFPLLCLSLAGRPHASPLLNRVLRLGLPWAWRKLVSRLDARLAAFRPDAIVVTQTNLGALLAAVKRRKHARIPTLGVLTDYGLHDFWRQRGIDYYCLPHEWVGAQGCHGIDAARVFVTGMPLMPGFADPPAARHARAALGLDPNRAVVLVLGGGLGLGVDAAAERLLAGSRDMQLVVLAGRNGAAESLGARLQARHGSGVRVLGWTERVDTAMRAADLVVGKPGGLSIAEALACGRPLIAVRSLGGQEDFNVRFLERHGVGRVVHDDGLTDCVAELLADRAGLERMQARAASAGTCRGAGRIADLALALAAHDGGRVEAPVAEPRPS
jgi:UDP-N-acetylglucosamine:LPS N-acetylglucosamine transferase